MAPLLAMALGGAALGALANKKDRKKGALMGLGLGLLGPAMGAAGIGAGGVLGTSLGAGGTAAATTGAAATGAAATVPGAVAGAAPVVELGMSTSAINANAAKLAAEQAAKKAAGDIAGSTLGSQLASGAGKAAIASAPVALDILTREQPQSSTTQTRSMSIDNRALGAPVDLYQQAALNRQQRMKQGLPGRRLRA